MADEKSVSSSTSVASASTSMDKMEELSAELMELQLRRARLGIIAEMIKMFS